jgi:UDP-N-acetylmuramoylalanine-D-glutamate ligase
MRILENYISEIEKYNWTILFYVAYLNRREKHNQLRKGNHNEKRKNEMTLLPFSDEISEGMTSYIEDNNLIIDYKNKTNLMTIHELALKGRHNVYNSMAAAIAGKVLNIKKEVIRESLADFQSVEHRLEPVKKVDVLTRPLAKSPKV